MRSFLQRRRSPGDSEVEFVSFDEVVDLLDEYGVEQLCEPPGPPSRSERVHLRMADHEGVVHLHLKCPQSTGAPLNGAKVVTVERERLANTVEHMIHLLHLTQVLLIPVGKWRKVFDAVAYSLAQNEDWQEIDATATVELNTRDPLLCEPADFHTLSALISALVQDADSPDQGLTFLAAGSPVLVEIVPDSGGGAVRISLGSQVLADEIADAIAS